MTRLSATQLKLNYGELEVFSGVDLEVSDRARIGIVGPNGGGKTSLLRVLLGELEPNGGTVGRANGLRVGYVPQTSEQTAAGSLRDEVMTAFDELRSLEEALASSGMEIQHAEAGERRRAERRYALLLERYEALGGYDYLNLMERVVAGVGLPLGALDTPVASASGGERTRASLARALLADPDLLVMDEPTNYLDFKGLTWLEGFLGHFSHAFIVVSHDRYLLDRVVSQVWELDYGRLQTFRGNYTKYRATKQEQDQRQQREFDRQQEYIAKEESFIQRYHAGQRSREARGRETRLARLERIEAPQKRESIHIGGVAAGRSGRVVVSTADLRVGFAGDGESVELLSVPDIELERGSRTAIIGPNGAGKTTLVETVLGLVPSLSGSVALGHNVVVGYNPQGSHDLPDDSTVLDALLDAGEMELAEARSHLARFLFQGDDVFAQVASLSGGERTRLALARLLVTEAKLLVLDEPTTHLDIPSREALDQALLTYDGTLLFVSHDRHLISRLAQQLWVLEDGAVHPFEGSFEEWVGGDEEARELSPRPRTRRPKPPRGRKRAPAPRHQPGPPTPDPEEEISRLESRLAQIERELEAASGRQDVAAVSRLGEEYNEAQSRLERAWSRWGGE